VAIENLQNDVNFEFCFPGKFLTTTKKKVRQSGYHPGEDVIKVVIILGKI